MKNLKQKITLFNVPVSLGGNKDTGDMQLTISWSNRAVYRIGSLQRPASLRDFADGQKAISAIIAYLWAMAETDAFAGPEQLAEYVNIEKSVEYVRAIVDCFEKETETEKNGGGSTRGDSHVSS